MRTNLTNTQVNDFLQDYEDNVEIILLEEGKDKKELIEIAKAKGINLKDNKDLIGFKCIYAFADRPNKNGAYLPEKDLLKALPTMIGKPVNISHNRRYIVGHLLDYRYKQKEKQVISYGVFYRSNLEDEYKQAKKDFKDKKLNVSFEIWSPKEKRKIRRDGSYELHEIEIAGCAILFRDEDPAFDGAKMLEFSSKLQKESPELVYASKYKEDEIILCDSEKYEVQKQEIAPNDTLQTIETRSTKKIKCSNCEEEFEINLAQTNNKCPKCFAIINSDGLMIFPPQIKDFKLLCPACKVNDWLITSIKQDTSKIKCLACAKEYKITFAVNKENRLAKDFQFIYSSSVRCLQCSTYITVLGTSSLKNREINCKKCGLSFSYDITHEKNRKITNIEILDSQCEPDKIEKSSEKGEPKMTEIKKKDKKTSEKKVKNIKEQKDESKVVIPKEEKQPEKQINKWTEKYKDGHEVEFEYHGDISKSPNLAKSLELFKVEKAKVNKAEEQSKVKVKDAPAEDKQEKITTVKTVESSLERYKIGIRKIAKKYRELRKSTDEKIDFYKSNAREIIKRREVLGEEFGKDLSDNDILNDDKFELAKAKKQNTLLKASIETGDNVDNVGIKKKGDEYYAKKRAEINKFAFRKTNE